MEKKNSVIIKLNEYHLSQIEDLCNSNIDVFVTLEDRFTVTLVVGTPQNLQYLMEKDQVNFYGPGIPWIVVRKLTKEIIEEAITAYIEEDPEAYWLKLHYFSTDIDPAVFNQLEAQERLEAQETDECN